MTTNINTTLYKKKQKLKDTLSFFFKFNSFNSAK